MAFDSCVLSSLIHNLLKPSLALDFISNETTKGYDVKITAKMLSFCMNETDSFLPSRKEESYYLLPSCADCIAVKEDSLIKYIYLLSRKTTVDVADMRQFETLSLCLRAPRPILLHSDYEFVNCKNVESDEPSEEEVTIMGKRVEHFMHKLIKCVVQYIWNWIRSFIEGMRLM